ncbi:hypothetical protein [Streptomyces lunaelactis]|nr:hypothetical protein [Streptomyces lunaelactis]NUK27620.1 hypothetical protein [Streptomyces lunaelactis]NUK88084.1 hypothetical protein [Streptomyces lunaelactis]
MRTKTLAAILLLLVGLAGCGSDGGEDTKPAAKPTVTANPDQQFLTAVRTRAFESWKDKGPTDEELAPYPAQWCAKLQAGHSVDYLLSLQGANLYPIDMDWGTAKPDAQELVVLGVESHCPALRAQVTQELRDSGGY